MIKRIPCEHWIMCSIKGGGGCAIDAHKEPSFAICAKVCLSFKGSQSKRAAIVRQLRRKCKLTLLGGTSSKIIHFLLDCIDAFIRPRSRHKLWIIEKIKTCGGCKDREKLIDRYAQHIINSAINWLKGTIAWQ